MPMKNHKLLVKPWRECWRSLELSMLSGGRWIIVEESRRLLPEKMQCIRSPNVCSGVVVETYLLVEGLQSILIKVQTLSNPSLESTSRKVSVGAGLRVLVVFIRIWPLEAAVEFYSDCWWNPVHWGRGLSKSKNSDINWSDASLSSDEINGSFRFSVVALTPSGGGGNE